MNEPTEIIFAYAPPHRALVFKAAQGGMMGYDVHTLVAMGWVPSNPDEMAEALAKVLPHHGPPPPPGPPKPSIIMPGMREPMNRSERRALEATRRRH